MATTFIEAVDTLDEIAERVNGARRRAVQARSAYGQAQTELASLPTVYAQFVSDLDAAAAANAWPQAADQKAAKDQMVTEFQALRSYVESVIAAIDGV